MELLIKAKEKYLLEAGIEVLHQECSSWLNTILFWEDECAFYADFLNNKLFEIVIQNDKKNIIALLDNMIGKRLSDFKTRVDLHEKNLAAVLRSDSNVKGYREQHKLLSQDFLEFESEMILFKEGVFELFKLVNKNFFAENETLHIIHERRSVRKYKKESINKLHIEQIIGAGRMAPTATNKQEWKFYVLTNEEKIKLYSSEICKVANNILHLSLKDFHNEEDVVFHGAPVVIFITAPKNNDWAALDVGMCCQNIMLAAKSLGYDSCPVALANAIEKTSVYKELHIPTDEQIKLTIVLGYGDEKPKTQERKTDNIIFLN
jgi:nitroreductase